VPFVGVDVPDEPIEAQDGNETTLLEVTNRFDHAVAVTADVPDAGSLDPEIEVDPAEIGQGEHAAVNATVECDDETRETLVVELEVTGDGVEVTLDREVEVDCEPAETDEEVEIRESEDGDDGDDDDGEESEDTDATGNAEGDADDGETADDADDADGDDGEGDDSESDDGSETASMERGPTGSVPTTAG
jgi:hypothetical protein